MQNDHNYCTLGSGTPLFGGYLRVCVNREAANGGLMGRQVLRNKVVT